MTQERDQLFFLVFDHRRSFRRLLGVGDDPSSAELEHLEDAKHLVWEGFVQAAERTSVPRSQLGVLVDEELGAGVARAAADAEVQLAMPIERAGRRLLELEHDENWARHIDAFDPGLGKALVRWNPGDDAETKRAQAQLLSRVGAWLHQTHRRLVVELLVPATDDDLARVDGDEDRYDTERRPELTRRAIREIRDLGIEPDVWQIEGVDDPADAEALSAMIRDEGRDGEVALVLGNLEDEQRFEQRLRTTCPLPGIAGLAVGRPAWERHLVAYHEGEIDRDTAVERIGRAFAHFIDVYIEAETS
jgi:myo-inositol catabolism protein IolC